MENRQHLYAVDAMQSEVLAMSLKVHCQLETQEVFSVSGNNLPVACPVKDTVHKNSIEFAKTQKGAQYTI